MRPPFWGKIRQYLRNLGYAPCRKLFFDHISLAFGPIIGYSYGEVFTEELAGQCSLLSVLLLQQFALVAATPSDHREQVRSGILEARRHLTTEPEPAAGPSPEHLLPPTSCSGPILVVGVPESQLPLVRTDQREGLGVVLGPNWLASSVNKAGYHVGEFSLLEPSVTCPFIGFSPPAPK